VPDRGRGVFPPRAVLETPTRQNDRPQAEIESRQGSRHLDSFSLPQILKAPNPFLPRPKVVGTVMEFLSMTSRVARLSDTIFQRCFALFFIDKSLVRVHSGQHPQGAFQYVTGAESGRTYLRIEETALWRTLRCNFYRCPKSNSTTFSPAVRRATFPTAKPRERQLLHPVRSSARRLRR
jgi:hypothetical protein